MTHSTRPLLLTTALVLTGCGMVGPDYQRPPPATSPTANFKETDSRLAEGFRPALPRDAIDSGPWWRLYGDPTLDQLAAQVDVSNQTLKSTEAAYRQATALIRQSQSGLFPTFGNTGNAIQTGSGSTRGGKDLAVGQYNFGFSIGWELDLWGRIRRTVEGDSASAQASAADLAAARLSAQSSLVTNYFSLRISDQRHRLLEDSVAAYQRALQIVQNQFAAGIASRLDVSQAETQYEQTRAQLVAEELTRALFEHAIAALIGRSPAELSLAPASPPDAVPTIDAGVPSALLERRPDIAAAERLMASANAQIGVAQAAYFPDFSLQATIGFASTYLSSLILTSSAVWSIGPQMSTTLIDGGGRGAQVEGARANYDKAVATYRQTVLTAFQQVEDGLAQQRVLAEQERVQRAAVNAAREAERLAFNQYRAGTVPYTTVIQTQTAALNAEVTLLAVRLSRFTASATLVTALGGGWRAEDLPPAVPVPGQETGRNLKKRSWWPF